MKYAKRPTDFGYEVYEEDNPNSVIGHLWLEGNLWVWELTMHPRGTKSGYQTPDEAFQGLVDYVTNDLGVS